MTSSIQHLAIMGDGGAGKTALTVQFVANHFVEYFDATIEDSYRKTVEIDGSPVLCDILDTAGQEEFSALRDCWIRDCDAFMLVYSITSRGSLAQIPELVKQIERTKEGKNYVIHVVANKCDLEESREVSTEEGRKFCKELGITSFSEVSAKTRHGLQDAWENLIRDAVGPTRLDMKKKQKARNAGCTIL